MSARDVSSLPTRTLVWLLDQAWPPSQRVLANTSPSPLSMMKSHSGESRTKLFPKVQDCFAWWTIFECSVERVSQFLIKRRGLKVRGSNTRVVTSPLTRFAFCSLHELATQACMTVPFIDPDHAKLEPHRNRMRSAY